MQRLKRFAERAAVAARLVWFMSFGITMLSLFGTGYCEHRARLSPLVPDALHGYTNEVNFKGQTRYVDGLDAHVCSLSAPISFLGGGVFVLIGAFYYSTLGRLP